LNAPFATFTFLEEGSACPADQQIVVWSAVTANPLNFISTRTMFASSVASHQKAIVIEKTALDLVIGMVLVKL
jgi:hypothetical protein